MERQPEVEITNQEIPRMVKRRKMVNDEKNGIQPLSTGEIERRGSNPRAAQNANDVIVDEILNQNQDAESHSRTQSDSVAHENADTSNEAQPTNPIILNDSLEIDAKEGVENIADLSDHKENITVTLSMSPIIVEPIYACFMVNVSQPSTVWCEAVISGNEFTPSMHESHDGTFIKGCLPCLTSSVDSGLIRVNSLLPDTLYDIYCYGTSESGDVSFSSRNTTKSIHTKAATFEIDNVMMREKSLSFYLISNIPVAATCVLFDSQCE